MLPEPRGIERRKADALARLRDDLDLWVATADEHGEAFLVPLSFLWWRDAIVLATPAGSPTGRNLAAGRRIRVALGELRDVVMIEGAAEVLGEDPECADAYAAKNDWDPRQEGGGYLYFRVVPRRIQAWREVNELRGRTLMRDGAWVDATPPG